MNHAPDLLALDKQLCFSLYSTSLVITQVYKTLLEPLNLTYPQYLVMLILWEGDGVNLNHIANLLGQQPGALTPVINRLAEQGFLKKSKSQVDERQLQIELTPQGHLLKTNATEINRCIYERCGMTQVALEKLKTELDALRKRILMG